jgi:hypothetical protein
VAAVAQIVGLRGFLRSAVDETTQAASPNKRLKNNGIDLMIHQASKSSLLPREERKFYPNREQSRKISISVGCFVSVS